MKIPETDILHTGELENLPNYKIFRRRFPQRASLPTRHLTDWYLQEVPLANESSHKVCLTGVYNGSIIKTSPVTSVISIRKVCTSNCIYVLEMPSKVLEYPIRGIENYFAFGFPSDWENIIEQAFSNKLKTIANEQMIERKENINSGASTIIDLNTGFETLFNENYCNSPIKKNISDEHDDTSQGKPIKTDENISTEPLLNKIKDLDQVDQPIVEFLDRNDITKRKESIDNQSHAHLNEIKKSNESIDNQSQTDLNNVTIDSLKLEDSVVSHFNADVSNSKRNSVKPDLYTVAIDQTIRKNSLKRASLESDLIQTLPLAFDQNNSLINDISGAKNNSADPIMSKIVNFAKNTIDEPSIEERNQQVYDVKGENDQPDSAILNKNKSSAVIDSINELFQSTVSDSDSGDYDDSLLCEPLNIKSVQSKRLTHSQDAQSVSNSKRNSECNSHSNISKNLQRGKKVLTVEEFVSKSSPFKLPPKRVQSIIDLGKDVSNHSFSPVDDEIKPENISKIDSRNASLLTKTGASERDANASLIEDSTKQDSFHFAKIDQDLFLNYKTNESNASFSSKVDAITTQSRQNTPIKIKRASISNNASLPSNLLAEENKNVLGSTDDSNIPDAGFLGKRSSFNTDVEVLKKPSLSHPDSKLNESLIVNNESLITSQQFSIASEECSSEILGDLISGDKPESTVKDQTNLNDSLMVLCEEDTINPINILISNASCLNQNDTFANSSICSNDSNNRLKKKSINKLKSFKKVSMSQKESLNHDNSLVTSLTPSKKTKIINSVDHLETPSKKSKKIDEPMTVENLSSAEIPVIITDLAPVETPMILETVGNESFVEVTKTIDDSTIFKPKELISKTPVKKLSVKLTRSDKKDFEHISNTILVDNSKKADDSLVADDTFISEVSDLIISKDFDSKNIEILHPEKKPSMRNLTPIKIVSSLEATEEPIVVVEEVKAAVIANKKKKRAALKLPSYFKGASKKK